MHFLSIWLCSIIAITNGNGASASTLKIPLWFFFSCWTLQFCMVFSINFKTSADTLCIHGKSISRFVGPYCMLLWSYYYNSLIRAFHISVRRWSFTGVWVTASLLKCPGLFLVFWPFLIMLSFGWSPLVLQLPSPLVPLVFALFHTRVSW